MVALTEASLGALGNKDRSTGMGARSSTGSGLGVPAHQLRTCGTPADSRIYGELGPASLSSSESTLIGLPALPFVATFFSLPDTSCARDFR